MLPAPMSPRGKAAALLVTAVVAGAATWRMLDDGSVDVPLPEEMESPATTAPAVEEGKRLAHAQGVRGRLLDPDGNPAPPTKIYLMQGAGTDLFRQLLLAQKGIRIPPLAAAESDANGQFQLGLEQVAATLRYEVRAASDRFVDFQTPLLALAQDEWHDLGDLRLQRGATVWGRVTDEGGGVAAPRARVLISATRFLPSLSPTPGREDGIEVAVDETGTFRTDRAAVGSISIAAVAPGYAWIEKQNVVIWANHENRVDFALPVGRSIAGVVLDRHGMPIAGAKVEAQRLKREKLKRRSAHDYDGMPRDALWASTGEDGRFEVPHLMEGEYRLAATAQGFVRCERKPFQAGDKNVQVVLDKQGEARLRVFDKSNRPMSSYVATVKAFFEREEQHVGNTDIPPVQVQPDANGETTIRDLDPGSYVFQVEAAGHCKAFSEPFAIKLGEDPPSVDVHMTEGGALEGAVVDATGKPVADAAVSTLPNHFDDTPFTEMFGELIPYEITKATATTDASGRYRFAMLRADTYQLKFTHPECVHVFRKGNLVEGGKTAKVPPVTMVPGTLVAGQVLVNGVAAVLKVLISSAPDPALFRCETISDNDGRFAMSRRLPPGRYQIIAVRPARPGDLEVFPDFARNRREFTIEPGEHERHLVVAIDSTRK